ncbi:hypothetical protein psyc5s11_38960 [Clostridium gelidum]|uniref:DUF4179 domain-containing protein n=1 Tax=Clostridium gelidum TaxID=704125 RepID=A0ABN6J0G7_9CLOT|nr:DUF4179 domain-containing protein [Clostridium gelidum]BCZ47829.1 hypothetical protein psyc5s11_38960 [Clostridium gelidum]
MKNNIYSMLNGANINLDDYEKEDLNDIEKKKIKANFRKSISKNKSHKRNMIVAGVALAFTVTLFGTNVGANALTNVLKIAGVEDIGSFLGIYKNLDEYKTVINKSITDNGITIKLNEVIVDGNEINVSYNISSDEKLKNVESPVHTSGLIYINNKVVFAGGCGSSKRIDDYKVQEVRTYDLGNNNLDGDLDMKIRFSTVDINGNIKDGKWVFEFKANGDELKADTREMELNNKFTLENGEEWTLEKYTDNSLGQKIYASVSNYKEKPRYGLVVSGNDNLNHYVRFRSDRADHIGKDRVVLKINKYDEKYNENAKTLTLTPYAEEFPDGEWKIEQIGKPFTIDLTQLK